MHIKPPTCQAYLANTILILWMYFEARKQHVQTDEPHSWLPTPDFEDWLRLVHTWRSTCFTLLGCLVSMKEPYTATLLAIVAKGAVTCSQIVACCLLLLAVGAAACEVLA